MPSSDGHRVTGDSGIPVLLPWGGHVHLTIPCTCAPHFLAPVSRIPKRDTENSPHRQVWAPGDHSFVLKTVSVPQPLSLMSQGISPGRSKVFVRPFALGGCRAPSTSPSRDISPRSGTQCRVLLSGSEHADALLCPAKTTKVKRSPTTQVGKGWSISYSEPLWKSHWADGTQDTKRDTGGKPPPAGTSLH